MEQTEPLAQEHLPVFQLKGSMVTLTTLELTQHNLEFLDKQLAEKTAQAPEFFQDAPIILALDKRLDLDTALDLPALLEICRQHGLRTLALRSERDSDIQAAAALGLTVLPPSLARERPLSPANAAVPAPTPPPLLPPKIIHTPIRSGQQIYAKHSDLIVTAAVSAGAELLADGNIHVYGPLRGRALAGVNGNPDARIFCQQLGAELVSIAGNYKIAEDLRRIPTWGAAAQIFLEDDQMIIQAL